ncbi:hypothetical protein BH11ARM2_BH11ARM2_06760 [soil metagenome]
MKVLLEDGRVVVPCDPLGLPDIDADGIRIVSPVDSDYDRARNRAVPYADAGERIQRNLRMDAYGRPVPRK